MSGTLFKESLRSNWIVALVLVLVILIYVTTGVSMFDPQSAEALTAMLDLLPEGLISAMGFANMGTELTEYLASYLYGFIMIMFPMIYCIIMGNRLIAKHLESGALAYLLTTPNTRVRIATTQAVYLAVSLLAVLAVPVAVAIAMSAALFPGSLRVGAFLQLNVITYLTMLVVSGITFLSSCTFSETRYSLAVGAGVPTLFFVFRMISGASDEFAWLKYVSVFWFIDFERIFSATGYVLQASGILLAASVALFSAGVVVFNRRSLAL